MLAAEGEATDAHERPPADRTDVPVTPEHTRIDLNSESYRPAKVVLSRLDSTGSVLPHRIAELAPDVIDLADWTVIKRLLRPLTDLSTHIGQVNLFF